METCLNYCNKDHAFFSSDERKFITKVRKLKEKYPDKVRIIKEPEDNDGCIYCELPVEWFKLSPKRVVSDETRVKMREQIKRMREHGQIHGQEAAKSTQKPMSGYEVV